jgi:hypothetical protein
MPSSPTRRNKAMGSTGSPVSRRSQVPGLICRSDVPLSARDHEAS